MLGIIIRDVDDVAGTDNTCLYLKLRLFQAHRGQRPEVLKIHSVGENVQPKLGCGLVFVGEGAHTVVRAFRDRF